jgi:hypothetical protein
MFWRILLLIWWLVAASMVVFLSHMAGYDPEFATSLEHLYMN